MLKNVGPLENFSPLLVFQAGYGPVNHTSYKMHES